MTVDPAEVTRRVEEVRRRIRAAGGVADGPGAVQVVAVTKTFGVDAIHAALAAGCVAIGENYAQEVVAKMAEFETGASSGSLRPEVHFIGRLQSNKVRLLAPVVDVWQSVDRSSVVDELARRAPGARILVQVNATGEQDKGGCPLPDLTALVERATSGGLVVEGLMTVGPTEGEPEDARPAFAAVRAACDRLAVPVCSMGMTHDLEVAVSEGATMVRIGTALFGARPPR